MKVRLYISIVLAFNLTLIIYLLLRPQQLQKSHIKIDLIDDFYKTESANINTLVLGDSTIAFGVDASLLKEAYSLAIPGATFLTINTELDRYLFKKSKPKCLLVWTASIAPYYNSYFWSVYLGSGLYSWEEIRKIYDDSVKLKAFPSSEYGLLTYLAKAYFYSRIYFSPLKQIKTFPFMENEKFYQEQKKIITQKKGFIPFLPADRGQSLITDRNTYLFEGFRKIESDDIYLKEVLSKTERENIKVIFVEMPILKNQDKAVYEFNERHIQNISEIIANYKHAEIARNVVDLEADQFRDISHLNTEGAKSFTQAMGPIFEERCEALH